MNSFVIAFVEYDYAKLGGGGIGIAGTLGKPSPRVVNSQRCALTMSKLAFSDISKSQLVECVVLLVIQSSAAG